MSSKTDIKDFDKKEIIEGLKKLQGFELYSSVYVASDKETSKDSFVISGTENLLIEIVAKYVYDNKIDLSYKNKLKKGKDFDYNDHEGYATEKSNYEEKMICRNWFNNGFYDEIKKYGEVIDYESNLIKYTKTNIDLISYNKGTKSLYLIEVKGKGTKKDGKLIINSQESLLRCILEIETYYETLKNNGLLKGFIENTCSAIKRDCFEKDRSSLNEDNIKLLILVPKESFAHKMFGDKEKYPYVHKLLKEKYTNIFVDFYENEQEIFTNKLKIKS